MKYQFGMIQNGNDLFDEEEEDVVIAGSELHAALSRLGYSDYEVIPTPNAEPQLTTAIDKPLWNVSCQDSAGIFKVLRTKILQTYQQITKDDHTLRERLIIISDAQHLLDDHAALIKSLLDECCQPQLGWINKLLSHSQYVTATVAVYYFVNHSNPLNWLVMLPVSTAACYKYMKWRSNRDLKKLISEQTDLHYTYKKALRILNQFFRMNTGVKQSGTKLIDFTSEKLKFLQPIMEKMLRSLQIISRAYYETTLSMANNASDLLRQKIYSEITCFEKNSFTYCGEVTYQSLKQLFYRYILIQSEMLLTLALFSHSDLQGMCNEIKRAIGINKKIQWLLKLTVKHKILISKIVNDFHSCKIFSTKYNYRAFCGSKWQDLYVRLHLTSHKIQNAYNNLTSVLEDIENHLDRRTNEVELVQTLKFKLNEVYKDTDKAKDLAQLSALIILKMEKTNAKLEEKNDEVCNSISDKTPQLDIRIIQDQDPEIVDEVFEEYIQEQYSEKLLNEIGDDYLESSKLDILLSRNLMLELKEVLVEKKKDTKERESRALEKMRNKNGEKTSASGKPSENISPNYKTESELKDSSLFSKEKSEKTGVQKLSYSSGPPPPPPPLPPLPPSNNCGFQQSRRRKDEEIEEEIDRKSTNFVPLPSSVAISLPLFLSNNEETFIGSGENSDEEIIDTNENLEVKE